MQLGEILRQAIAAATFQRGKELAMNVALWAEIRRLAEIEKLSGWAISRRLHCSRHTVAAALEVGPAPRAQGLAPRQPLGPAPAKIDALLAKYPELSAVRIREEIARGPDGYTGSTMHHPPLSADHPSRARACLPGSPLRAGPGDAGRLGRVRPRAGRRPRPARFRCSWPCSATAG